MEGKFGLVNRNIKQKQNFFRLTVDDILALLHADGDNIIDARVYFEPPENHLQSDEDDEGDINRLSGNQLRASAELHAVTVTEEGVETLVFGVHDEPGIKSSLKVQPQIQDATLPSSSQTQINRTQKG